MTTNIIERRAKTLNNFRNFCAFVTSEHNIQIHTHLETTAMATKGAIYVPDISDMTENQILMVYSCVLHEVGHIKHSTFDKKYFSQLFNGTIAFIANVLEDAREESLLCDEFAGAEEIFRKSTTLFISQHPEIKEMIEFDFKDIEFFKCFTLWLGFFSHRSVTIDMNVFEKNMPREAMREVKEFLEETNFIQKFSNLKFKLVTQKDVLSYTKKIYDLLGKKYRPKTVKLSLDDMIDAKTQLVSQFNKMKKITLDNIEKINKEQIDLINKNSEAMTLFLSIKKQNESHEKKISDTQKITSEINNRIKNYSRFIQMDSAIECNTKANEEGKEDIKNREAKVEEISSQQEDLEKEVIAMIKQLHALDDIAKNQKKRESLQKKIDARKEKISKIKIRLEKASRIIDEKNADIEKIQNYKDSFKDTKKQLQKDEKNLKGKTQEEIRESIDAMVEEISVKTKTMQKLTTIQEKYMIPHTEKMEDIEEIHSNISFLIFINSRHMYKSIMDMTQFAVSHELTSRIMPNISMNAKWPSMASFQQEQDLALSKKSRTIIVDGVELCSNEDDILWLLEVVEERINDIDPLLQFKKLVAPCFKDKMSIMNQNEMYVIEEQKVTPISHNVFNSSFDKVENKNKVSNIEKNEFKLFCKKHEEKIGAITETVIHTLQPKKQNRWVGNKSDGFLDNRNLWKYASGEERIFQRNQINYNQPTSISLVLDLSTSNYFNYTSVEDMKIFAKGVSDALIELNIDHEILGYYAEFCPQLRAIKGKKQFNRRNHSLNTHVFKKFDEENNEGIHNIKLHVADNSDGESLKLAVERLNRQSGSKKIVLMLSDFMPQMYEANSNLLIKDFQNSVKFAKTHNTKIYGFNLNDTAMTNTIDEFPMFSIKELSTKSIESLENEQFFEFLLSIKQ